MKKGWQLLCLPALCMLLCACPPQKQDNDQQLRQLRADHYDFKKLHSVYFGGLHFMLPPVFKHSNQRNFALHSNGFMQTCQDLGMHISVDAFDKEEVEKILEDYDENVLVMDAVHDFFITKRKHSLDEDYYYESSIISELPGKRKGSVSVIEQYDEIEGITYLISTIRKGENFYVFQFICSTPMAQYMHDDFIRIVQSAS